MSKNNDDEEEKRLMKSALNLACVEYVRNFFGEEVILLFNMKLIQIISLFRLFNSTVLKRTSKFLKNLLWTKG